ncbi:glycosyltransferase [Nocardioides sp. NPDC057767]|uniref:glycosyltransferase n=1 Tax=unclassified Nocardioides TaxID=2615069 RepID=UPI003672F61F
MRILGVSTAGAGHFNPMKPWLKRLAECGHEVTVVGPPGLAAAAHEFEFRVGAAPDPASVAAIWQRVAESPMEVSRELVLRDLFGRLNSEAMIPAVRAAIDDLRPDLVLRDPAEYASALAAAEAGVPHVRLGVSLCSQIAFFESAAAPVLEAWRPGLHREIVDSPLLTRFPASLDPSPVSATGRYRVGEPPARDVDPGFVYATLGTVAPTMPPMRPWFGIVAEVLGALPVRAVFTIGHDLDPARIAAAPNVRIETWADHADVLSRAAVVVHHGGSGTVLDALAAGVPQVIVPLFADQGANGAAIVKAGVGTALPHSGGSAFHIPQGGEVERLQTIVAETMASDTVRGRAAEVAAELSALPELDIAMLGLT